MYEGSPMSEVWLASEITEKAALDELSKLGNNEFDALVVSIETGLKERYGEYTEVNGAHTNQVATITEVICRHSPKEFQTDDEIKIAKLCALLHDLEKGKTLGNLATHAYLAAADIPKFLGENLDKLGLEPMENLGKFISRAVETHSSIPYISEHLQETLSKIEDPKQAPRLIFSPDKKGIISYELPEPADKYGFVLRAADSLSNYGLIPEMAQDKADNYAGFLKIVGINVSYNKDTGKLKPLSEVILGIERTALLATHAGVFGREGAVLEYAKESIFRMSWLQQYFESHPDLDKTTLDPDITQEKLFEVCFAGLDAIEENIGKPSWLE